MSISSRRSHIVCDLRRCDVGYVSEHCIEAFEHDVPIGCRTVDEIAGRERAQHARRLRNLECIESWYEGLVLDASPKMNRDYGV